MKTVLWALLTDGRTDGRTRRRTDTTKLIVAFRNFVNGPEKILRNIVMYIGIRFE